MLFRPIAAQASRQRGVHPLHLLGANPPQTTDEVGDRLEEDDFTGFSSPERKRRKPWAWAMDTLGIARMVVLTVMRAWRRINTPQTGNVF